MRQDYFENRILTLIRAEMWKILISFKPEEEFVERFRLVSRPDSAVLRLSLKINSDYFEKRVREREKKHFALV